MGSSVGQNGNSGAGGGAGRGNPRGERSTTEAVDAVEIDYPPWLLMGEEGGTGFVLFYSPKTIGSERRSSFSSTCIITNLV